MTRLTITIRKDADRQQAHDLVRSVPSGTRVEFKEARRSLDQNAKFWALLHDVAEQVSWHGVKLSAEDFKYLFLDALKREVRIVPNIDGNGFVALGRSSSDLTVSEMSDTIEIIYAFGANHGVTFNEPESPNSSDPLIAPTRTNTPAVDSPQVCSAAGVPPHEDATLLADDWRHTYIVALSGPRDRPESLLTRHQQAIQMVGGQPNDPELAWMRRVWRLVQRRDEGKLKKTEFATEIEKLETMPLPIAKDAA